MKSNSADPQQISQPLQDGKSLARAPKAKRRKATNDESPVTEPRAKRQNSMRSHYPGRPSTNVLKISSDDDDSAWETASESPKPTRTCKSSMPRKAAHASARAASPSHSTSSDPSIWPPIPRLQTREHSPFHLGLITALENIHEDHGRNPTWSVVDIVEDSEANKAQHAKDDWRMRAVLKGAQCGYAAVKALAEGTKVQKEVRMSTVDFCLAIGRWAERGFTERGWVWPEMRWEGGRWEWDEPGGNRRLESEKDEDEE
jgi:hypothetical protein